MNRIFCFSFVIQTQRTKYCFRRAKETRLSGLLVSEWWLFRQFKAMTYLLSRFSVVQPNKQLLSVSLYQMDGVEEHK